MRLTKIKKATNTSANAEKSGFLRLLSAPARYIKRKIESAYKKLVKKEQKNLPSCIKWRNAEKKVNRWVKRDCQIKMN